MRDSQMKNVLLLYGMGIGGVFNAISYLYAILLRSQR
jgi:hypothetical protein